MADSSLAITGGNVDTRTSSTGDHRQVVVLGADGDTVAGMDLDQQLYVRAGIRPSDLHVTNTATAGTAVTLTLPAPAAGLFHHIYRVHLTAYTTAARTGGATPVLVTTTNLPGSPVWTFASAAAVGTTATFQENWTSPLKSSVAATATTIVAPATTSVIWRLSANYYVSR